MPGCPPQAAEYESKNNSSIAVYAVVDCELTAGEVLGHSVQEMSGEERDQAPTLAVLAVRRRRGGVSLPYITRGLRTARGFSNLGGTRIGLIEAHQAPTNRSP